MLCWTYSPMASIESNLLLNGNWAATGKPGVPDLSESHLDWWNGFTIFDNGDADSSEPAGVFFGAGNYKYAAAYLSRGDGPIGELGLWSQETAPAKYDIDYEYYYVGDIEWYILEPDLSNIDLLKQQIMTGGPLSTAICRFEEFMTGYDQYQPPSSVFDPNHGVAIIGWDDNRITPGPAPGAWLCKNNNGLDFSDYGYFWVSYYDKHCCRHPEVGAVAFLNADILPGGHFYNHVYCHDYHGWRDTLTDCHEAFNAFTVPRDQILNAVSFYTAADSVTYTMTVYDAFELGQLSGELATKTGMIEYAGYHTVSLESPVDLTAGDDFYIYVNLSTGGQAFDRTREAGLLLAGMGEDMIVPSRAEPGQSYFHDLTGWHDLYDVDTTANFCIKGIASELSPQPADIIAVRDGGDGQTLMAVIAEQDPIDIDYLIVYCEDTINLQTDSMIIPATETEAVFTGLTEERSYRFHALAVDQQGRRSLAFRYAFGIPRSLPAQPRQLESYTMHDAIKLYWWNRNTELDFSHYTLYRDGVPLPDLITDTVFIDDDPALGYDYHTYLVASYDTEGKQSDTTGIVPISMRAAELRPDEILAINRSGSNSSAMVNETVTGEFMREALEGLSYRYFSDTAAANPHRAGLMEMIDYGLIVIGAESGRQDDIGGDPNFGGILDQIGHYLAIGGKAVIFGRWGDISLDLASVDTVEYLPGVYNSGYNAFFSIDYRVIPRTYINAVDIILESDLIGAHSQNPEYPDLTWDSLATADHSGTLNRMTGIPCPSYAVLTGADYEVIYTYNSSVDSTLTEGMPVAWRNIGGPYEYVYFDLPLSFIEREAAVTALRQAVGDLGIITDVDDNTETGPMPRDFELAQNCPNPFNPVTVIEFYNPEPRRTKVTLEIYNILGQRVRVLLDEAADPGWNRVEWDGRDQFHDAVASGIYFYRLKTGNTSLTRKMMLLK